MSRMNIIPWSGHDLRRELLQLSVGQYVIQAVDGAPELRAEEDAGLEAALLDEDVDQVTAEAEFLAIAP